MDALSKHLDSLASLGTSDGQGHFTLSPEQVWERLRQALPDGSGSLRFLLRWLHARSASEISIVADRASGLLVQAIFGAPAALPALARGEQPDLSGRDIDLARCAVAAQMLQLPLEVSFDDGQHSLLTDFQSEPMWRRGPGSGQVRVCATYRPGRQHWSGVLAWEQDTRRRFRCSPLPVGWNEAAFSGPYSFDVPVLIWRHLRPREPDGPPLIVMAPRTARASFRAVRPRQSDVVLGMLMGSPSGEGRGFELLRHGELLPLPQAERELAGFGGVIRDDSLPVDLEGDKPVWTSELQSLVAGFKDEAVDMALQLYHLEPPLEPHQAEAVFLSLQSVLLHLLDHQRFTEGHLLADWLRARLAESELLHDFRTGYTFDRICSLLAEPAGHPQTAARWRKSADARVREASARDREVVDEALLVTARLELRSRRNHSCQLTGDTQARLAQLAFRQERGGRYREAADIFMMLAMALLPGDRERIDYLTQAARCGQQAGLPYYAGVLAREKTARSSLGRE